MNTENSDSTDEADQLTTFLFDGQDVRGAVVSMDRGLEAMFGLKDYPTALRSLLGQAAVAMPLLASHIKDGGRLNLQFQGHAALKLLVAQIDERLRVRATARFEEPLPQGFRECLAAGTLALTIEPGSGARNYQAFVEVQGASLAEAIEGYFRQSEQLETRLLLASGAQRLSGLLLQRLPASSPNSHPDFWEHVDAILATLNEDELLTQPPHIILHRLFHAEKLRLFPSRPVQLRCRCDHASVSRMLVGLGRAEVDALLNEQGQIEVRCEFCGQAYSYGRAECESLLGGLDQPRGHAPLH